MNATRTVFAACVAALMLEGGAAGAAPTPPAPFAPGPVPTRSLPAQTIIVTGRGTAEAAPDRGIVTVGVQVTRPTAQEALERASATMTQVLRQVTALGIPRERMQTVEINLYPQRRPSSAEITGYQAVQRAAITVDDLALVGRVFDAAAAGGANLLDGVSFTLRDPGVARGRAFSAAVQDARATANALAAAAGVNTLRIVQIEEIGASIPVRGRALATAPQAETPVLPGTLSINVQVRAVFAF